jgi:hypothetical protein
VRGTRECRKVVSMVLQESHNCILQSYKIFMRNSTHLIHPRT